MLQHTQILWLSYSLQKCHLLKILFILVHLFSKYTHVLPIHISGQETKNYWQVKNAYLYPKSSVDKGVIASTALSFVLKV